MTNYASVNTTWFGCKIFTIFPHIFATIADIHGLGVSLFPIFNCKKTCLGTLNKLMKKFIQIDHFYIAKYPIRRNSIRYFWYKKLFLIAKMTEENEKVTLFINFRKFCDNRNNQIYDIIWNNYIHVLYTVYINLV